MVLSRKKGEQIVIGGDGGIVVTVVDIRGDKVRIGITAPKAVGVHRKEVWEQLVAEGRVAAAKQEAEPAGR